MAKAPIPPSAARTALQAAVQAVRDRDAERLQTEAAVKLAQIDVEKSYDDIGDLETQLQRLPKSNAQEILDRVSRHSQIATWAERELREQEPQTSRDLKARLALAQEILEDRKSTRAELQARIEGFDRHDYTLDRAKRAARAVVLDEAGELVAKIVADAEAALLTLTKVRATLGWMVSHRIWGDLDHHVPQPVRDALVPFHETQERQTRAARASSAWANVIDGLLADPSMTLPGLDQF